jgi:hypothetical protein
MKQHSTNYSNILIEVTEYCPVNTPEIPTRRNSEEGKVALVALNSAAYKKLATDKTVKHLKAMRSKKAWEIRRKL